MMTTSSTPGPTAPWTLRMPVPGLRRLDVAGWTITTTATDDKSGKALLEAFSFPFRK